MTSPPDQLGNCAPLANDLALQEKINVAFCIDPAYAQHLGVALVSLFTHNEAQKLQVLIATSQLDPAARERLAALGRTFGATLIFKEILDQRCSESRQHLHLSRAADYRLLLPDLLAEEEKVIYLDCDLVVEADLRELWETELSDCGCAGVDEGNPAQTGRLGLDPDFYINSGVLVIDLAYWRTHEIGNQCLAWIEANRQKTILLDQDAINVVLKNRKRRLDLKWNLNPVPLEDIGVLQKYPAHILHFGGPIKPWHKCYDFALQAIYRKYLDLTPWAATFVAAEPRNGGQACLVANQLFLAADFLNACRYYQMAIEFRLKIALLDSKLLLDCINGGHRHFNHQEYVSACDHYRSCLEHWGYPIAYQINLYTMPGVLDGAF